MGEFLSVLTFHSWRNRLEYSPEVDELGFDTVAPRRECFLLFQSGTRGNPPVVP
jgi:hypothetical protein